MSCRPHPAAPTEAANSEAISILYLPWGPSDHVSESLSFLLQHPERVMSFTSVASVGAEGWAKSVKGSAKADGVRSVPALLVWGQRCGERPRLTRLAYLQFSVSMTRQRFRHWHWS